MKVCDSDEHNNNVFKTVKQHSFNLLSPLQKLFSELKLHTSSIREGDTTASLFHRYQGTKCIGHYRSTLHDKVL